VITRRSVLLAGGIGLLVAHRLGHGQAAATIRRVGMLLLASDAAGTHLRAAFKQGMHDLGWLEGKNVESDRLRGRRREPLGRLGQRANRAESRGDRGGEPATHPLHANILLH
jgi:hypothetical protein